MNNDSPLTKLQDAAGLASTNETGASSLIGFFQAFRPNGKGLMDFFARFPGEGSWQLSRSVGELLDSRIADLFAVAGDDRRPQAGRDAYFVVRNPDAMEPDQAEHHARQWIQGLRELALSANDEASVGLLNANLHVRVLEGTPPKSPKLDHEKTDLLRFMQSGVPRMVNRIDAGPLPELLGKAYYFVACDAMLRDHLMWPLYQSACSVPDPFADYFQLWCHGIKYRIFQPHQIDLYLPRQVLDDATV